MLKPAGVAAAIGPRLPLNAFGGLVLLAQQQHRRSVAGEDEEVGQAVGVDVERLHRRGGGREAGDVHHLRRAPRERPEAAGSLAFQGPKVEGVGAGGRLALHDVEQLGRSVSVEVGQVHGDGLARDRQRSREAHAAVLHGAAADLLLLLGDDVDLVLAVVVEVGQVKHAAAEQTGKGLPRAQARAAALPEEPDLGVRGVADDDVLLLVAVQVADGQRPAPVAPLGKTEEDQPAPLVLLVGRRSRRASGPCPGPTGSRWSGSPRPPRPSIWPKAIARGASTWKRCSGPSFFSSDANRT